jgi:cell division protein FtsZ
LFELDEAANRIREEVDPDANIIVGSTLDPAMEGVMRVSVVATGIDASEVVTDVPVPRRSMSAPLTATVAAEESVETAEIPEPMQADVAASSEEPSLFEGMNSAEIADASEDAYAAPADDLPPPAYKPEVAAFEPRSESIEAQPEEYVAPRAPAPGTPSPETLARLKAATQRVAPASAPAPSAAEDEKPRFGINSLINRMTGQNEGAAAVPPRAQPPVQRTAAAAPAPAPQQQAEADEDQERIEIPAFLRRQAN